MVPPFCQANEGFHPSLQHISPKPYNTMHGTPSCKGQLLPCLQNTSAAHLLTLHGYCPFPKGRGTKSDNVGPASATLSLEALTLRAIPIAKR